MTSQTLILPERIRLKLTDMFGKPVALADVLFHIHAFARRKNDFSLGLGQVRAESLWVEWDGQRSEYEHSVVVKVIGR
jgi:hypothetical protein